MLDMYMVINLKNADNCYTIYISNITFYYLCIISCFKDISKESEIKESLLLLV
jgi:hypothetical protein